MNALNNNWGINIILKFLLMYKKSIKTVENAGKRN